MAQAQPPSPCDSALSIGISPLGALHLIFDALEAPLPVEAAAAQENIVSAFAQGAGAGLLYLGAVLVDTPLSPSLSFFREMSRRFITRLCAVGDIEEVRGHFTLPPVPEELDRMAAEAPPMVGAEYLDGSLLAVLWAGLESRVRAEIADSAGSVQSYLRKKNPVWNLVGLVHFHLAETKNDEEHPFAFLATFTTRVSGEGGGGARVRHLPLGQALNRFSGDRAALLSLLAPVDEAARQSPFLKQLVDAGEIFSPQAFTAKDAYAFLKDIPLFEAAGVVTRVPDWWKKERPKRVRVQVTVGKSAPSSLGMSAMLDFQVALSLDGEPVTEAELSTYLEGGAGLRLIRGKWVELDEEKLGEVLAHWKKAQSAASRDGLSFREGMRLLSGLEATPGDDVRDAGGASLSDAAGWSFVGAGDWLRGVLQTLRQPEELADGPLRTALHATLRPYQEVGVRWLGFLSGLGLGACLADDMGLGKTIQVLGLLLSRKPAPRPALLVAPASLLGNWQSEIERFAPSLGTLVVHPSAMSQKDLAALSSSAGGRMAGVDLVITTYGSVHRMPWLAEREWGIVVLDEAQAIKNPAARQARAVKQLKAESRIALTGTPIENRLGDLWSLFDFLNPGLLGGAKQFSALVKRLSSGSGPANYGPLRNLVRPYILRRMKTDKRIIFDLPDKTEVRAHCGLSKKQAALYQESVEELRGRLARLSGIERRGVVLSFLLRFKQICNHPSQWLGDSGYAPDESGKFARLSEICEEIVSRQEKALVFTQFREMTAPLFWHLQSIFGAPGLVLHGGTPVKERKALVDRFQNEDRFPYFVLSLKAGGTGLNLTAASHVIHFDRWWNPAVENQATDRAFRIGQKKNVLVHKFVCRGTIEEKIEALIDAKKSIAGELLEGGGEVVLTEMGDDELIDLVSLDIHRALAGD